MEHKDYFLFTKQLDYRDESEFRIVLVNKKAKLFDDTEAFFNISDALMGIVLGDRFPSLYAPTINELVKELSAAPRKLYWQEDGYGVYDLDKFKW